MSAEDLLNEGSTFNFNNNNYSAFGERFSKASDDLLAWIVKVEHFIIANYGENSAAFRLYSKLNRKYLNGNYQNDFENQLNLLRGALKACQSLPIQNIEEKPPREVLLQQLFDRFHEVVKQLRNRYNNRPTLDVNDEYDVQDLLHALLKLYFEDIRKEEWTPSYAGGSARMDFLLKKEQVVIEVKKTRNGLNDKELGKQLIEDKAKYEAYHGCKKVICFVYDPEGRIVNPKGIQNDLNSDAEDFKVEIIIKP